MSLIGTLKSFNFIHKARFDKLAMSALFVGS